MARERYNTRQVYAAVKERDETRSLNRQLTGDLAAERKRTQVLQVRVETLQVRLESATEGRREKAAIAACNRKDVMTAEKCVRQSTKQGNKEQERLQAVAMELEAERAGRQAEREAGLQTVARLEQTVARLEEDLARLQASLTQTSTEKAELQKVVNGCKGRGKAGLAKRAASAEATVQETFSHWRKELGLKRSRQIPARRPMR